MSNLAKREALSTAEIEKALVTSHGLVTLAAEQLGCTADNVRKRVKSHPRLARIMQDCNENLVDRSILGLRNLVDSEHFGAIKTVLLNSKEGRARGWAQQNQVGVNISFDVERIAEPRDADGNVLELPSEIE